jgi:bifunctional oligoribonuclease and PAP phosphatase NrnA
VSAAAEFANWLADKSRLLVVTHQRPDGDAIGSLLGLHHCLLALGKDSVPFVDAPLPARYAPYSHADLVVCLPMDLNEFDGVICLDSANEDRLALPNDMPFSDFDIPTCSIDHHVDNTRYGDFIHVDPTRAATASILAEIIRENAWPLSADGATLLYLGMVTDTGGFHFTNTTSKTLRTAAWLLDQNANFAQVMNDIFFNEPLPALRLRARIIEDMRQEHDGRLVYFIVTDELLASFGIAARDTEDLIETVRQVAGAKIVCRMQPNGSGVRYSLRSKDEAYPVIGIAHKIGGGGHKMAAGAFRPDISLAEGERLLIDYVGKVLNE